MKVLKMLIAMLLIAASLIIFAYALEKKESSDSLIINSESDSVKKNSKKITVVIDAGHGGFDGGAVAIDKSAEKDLNLEYALALERILSDMGIDTVMTRSDDTALAESGENRKARDLKKRLEIASEKENCLFVSIHMNKFSDERVKGATVYYSPNHADGRSIAESIMEMLENNLPEAGKRPIKEADSSIYILKRITCPAILFECGFISNSEELCRLKDAEYKEKLMTALAMSIKNYIEEQ